MPSLNSLDGKSQSELRGIAQSLGIFNDTTAWSWDKITLIRKINVAIGNKLYAPIKSDEPDDGLPVHIRPPMRNLKQTEVVKALEKFSERGLIYTFPTPDTIQFTFTITRQANTTLRAPLKDVINCAKAVISG